METMTIAMYTQPLKKIHFSSRTVDTTYPLHIHNYYELELITSGVGLNRINGMSFPVSRGSLYLLTPNDTHQLDFVEPISLVHAGFLPDPDNGLVLPMPEGAYSAQLSEEDTRAVLDSFDVVAAENSSHELYGLQGAYAALSLILIRLFRSGSQYAVTSSLKRLQPALQLIWQRCTDVSLDLKTAADACSLSVCYFSSLFHKTCGGSFSLESEPGKGTLVEASVQKSNIDTPPLGDIGEIVMDAIQANGDIEYELVYETDVGRFEFSTLEAKEMLEGVSILEPDILLWIRDYINEGISDSKEDHA